MYPHSLKTPAGGRLSERGDPSSPRRRSQQLPGRAGANQLGGEREREGGLGMVRSSALGLAKVRVLSIRAKQRRPSVSTSEKIWFSRSGAALL